MEIGESLRQGEGGLVARLMSFRKLNEELTAYFKIYSLIKFNYYLGDLQKINKIIATK